MNTNIKNNKMGLGLKDNKNTYMIKYDTQAKSPLRIQKTDITGNKEIFEFYTIKDTALFLKNDGFDGYNDCNDKQCPQMLVNTFNNSGQVIS